MKEHLILNISYWCLDSWNIFTVWKGLCYLFFPQNILMEFQLIITFPREIEYEIRINSTGSFLTEPGCRHRNESSLTNVPMNYFLYTDIISKRKT